MADGGDKLPVRFVNFFNLTILLLFHRMENFEME
jgi:hypothetical protein